MRQKLWEIMLYPIAFVLLIWECYFGKDEVQE
jgi:hypothetical protein